MVVDHDYKQGSGDYIAIDVITATDDTTFHEVKVPVRFKAVDVQPIDADAYLYVNSTDTDYRTIFGGTSLSIDLAKFGNDVAFYIRSSAAGRIEILFLQ